MKFELEDYHRNTPSEDFLADIRILEVLPANLIKKVLPRLSMENMGNIIQLR
jgi:hypothetical protein